MEQLEPPARVWHEIRRRTRLRPSVAWRWGLAGAAAAALVLGVVMVGLKPWAKPAKHPGLAGLSREKMTAGLAEEYREFVRGIDEAISECEAALAENPQNARVRVAYLAARTSRLGAAGMLLGAADAGAEGGE